MTHQLLFEREIRSFDKHVREDDSSIMTHHYMSHQGMLKELVENLLNPISVHFTIVRLSDFGPDSEPRVSEVNSNLEQNRKFVLL